MVLSFRFALRISRDSSIADVVVPFSAVFSTKLWEHLDHLEVPYLSGPHPERLQCSYPMGIILVIWLGLFAIDIVHCLSRHRLQTCLF